MKRDIAVEACDPRAEKFNWLRLRYTFTEVSDIRDAIHPDIREQPKVFSLATIHRMIHYSWPGNVRELEQMIERAMLLGRGEEVEAGEFALSATRTAAPSIDDLSIDEAEAILIRKTLYRCDGNISQVAEA